MSSLSSSSSSASSDVSVGFIAPASSKHALLFHGRYDHIRKELLARQEWPEVFERLGDHRAIGLRLRLDDRLALLVGGDHDFADHRALAAEHVADGRAQMVGRIDPGGGQSVGL